MGLPSCGILTLYFTRKRSSLFWASNLETSVRMLEWVGLNKFRTRHEQHLFLYVQTSPYNQHDDIQAYLFYIYFFLLSGCQETLGVSSGLIKDSQFTASSSYDEHHQPYHARLNKTVKGSRGGWCSAFADETEFLEINLGKKKSISGELMFVVFDVAFVVVVVAVVVVVVVIRLGVVVAF